MGPEVPVSHSEFPEVAPAISSHVSPTVEFTVLTGSSSVGPEVPVSNSEFPEVASAISGLYCFKKKTLATGSSGFVGISA